MRRFVQCVLILMILPIATVWGEKKSGLLIPHEATIISTDQRAVERLGAGRGALGMKPDIREILWNTSETGSTSSTSPASRGSRSKNPGLIIPHEATIVYDDQQAVERLGTGRGALALKPDIREMDWQESDTQAVVLNLNQAMVDLEAEVRKDEILINLSTDVLFDFDKADIKGKAEPELRKLALIIQEKAKGTVAINGHTDSKGSDEYNRALSVRRAETVNKWLVKKGGADADYQIVGFGETQPAAPNTTTDGQDNPEGRAKNRRVEIVIKAAKL